MKRMWFLILFLAIMPALARADTKPALLSKVGACESYTMCSAQTALGVCTKGTPLDEIVLPVFGKWSSFTFFSNLSVGTSYTCNVHGNQFGHDNEGGSFVLLSSTALSKTNESISLLGGNFGHIWINCSAIFADATIAITVNACPASR